LIGTQLMPLKMDIVIYKATLCIGIKEMEALVLLI